MSEQTWAEYREALTALAQVDAKQRAALARAIGEHAHVVERLKAAKADQQRSFDRAKREVASTREKLTILHRDLGVQPPPLSPISSTSDTPSLRDISTTVDAIAKWADEAAPTLASLKRSQSRLRKAEAAEAAVVRHEPAVVLHDPVLSKPQSAMRGWLIPVCLTGIVVISVIAWLVLR